MALTSVAPASEKHTAAGDRILDAARVATHVAQEAPVLKSVAADAIDDGVHATRRTAKAAERGVEELGDLKDDAIRRVTRAPLLAIGAVPARSEETAVVPTDRSPARQSRSVLETWLVVRLIAFAGALGAAGAVAFAAQRSVPNPASLAIRSLAGRDLFEFYCATCHGGDGKGHGPVAAALKVPPPDLSRLADAGAFPRQRVEAYVTNGGNMQSPAHGTSEMPVWGPVFRALDPSDTRARIRIANVVDYIESLQGKQ